MTHIIWLIWYDSYRMSHKWWFITWNFRVVYVKLGASHGESIFMESKIYPQSQEIMTADIEVLFEFIAASVHDFCKPEFWKSISHSCIVHPVAQFRIFEILENFQTFWKKFKLLTLPDLQLIMVNAFPCRHFSLKEPN